MFELKKTLDPDPQSWISLILIQTGFAAVVQQGT